MDCFYYCNHTCVFKAAPRQNVPRASPRPISTSFHFEVSSELLAVYFMVDKHRKTPR